MQFISTTSRLRNGTEPPAGIFNFRTKLTNRGEKRISSRIAEASQAADSLRIGNSPLPKSVLIERISWRQCLGNNGLENLRRRARNNRRRGIRAYCKEPPWTSD